MYATTTSIQIMMVGTLFDTATTSLCEKMIEQAANEVNKLLGKRYDISDWEANPPPMVVTLTEQLAEGYMYLRNARGGKEQIQHAQALIKMPMDNLEALAEYKADLLDDDGVKVPDSTNSPYRVLSNTTGYSSTFNEDNPLNWKVSPSKLSDIKDERDGDG